MHVYIQDEKGKTRDVRRYHRTAACGNTPKMGQYAPKTRP